MITTTTLLTLGGAGLAFGGIEATLKAMGKEEFASFINILSVAGLGGFALFQVSKLLTLIGTLFL